MTSFPFDRYEEAHAIVLNELSTLSIPVQMPNQSIDIDGEFLRYSLINNPGINTGSFSGLLIVDMFVAANMGLRRALDIARSLDALFLRKSLSLPAGTDEDGNPIEVRPVFQCITSTFIDQGQDPYTPTLHRFSLQYVIHFFQKEN